MSPRCWIVLLGSVLVLGCCRENKPAATPEQLKGRLDAAAAISNIGEKDSALATVAQDAADAGHGEFVNRAIDQIVNIGLKSSTTYTCALKLSERGKSQEATELAKKIPDIGKRNEILGKIARGR